MCEPAAAQVPANCSTPWVGQLGPRCDFPGTFPAALRCRSASTQLKAVGCAINLFRNGGSNALAATGEAGAPTPFGSGIGGAPARRGAGDCGPAPK